MKKLKVYAEDRKCIPTRAYPTDAGLDLKASKTTVIKMGTTTLVPCGIKIQIEKGYVGLIYPRSGLALKHGINLANSVGVIDSCYRGEIMCALKYNDPKKIAGTYKILKYDRIAQLVITPIELPEIEIIDNLSNTERGEGGFGHTG